MKNKTATWAALRGLVLAGGLGAMSVGQSAKAVFVFDVVDADTFTVTASGSSLTGSPNYFWGITGSLSTNGSIASSPEGTVPTATQGGFIHYTASTISGLRLSLSPFGSGSFTLSDGGVYTVSNVTLVDLTTLTLPSSPLPLTTGGAQASGTDNSLVFTAVPEPSSTAILALSGCAMLLRRRRA
ncbi:MAG: PEP-CTERM sorting domain-containing protein [Akkermansiaceae bacterium]|nr:PEP-CTERM sorting domain-containing protein [Akkermansiaceae bacterium]